MADLRTLCIDANCMNIPQRRAINQFSGSLGSATLTHNTALDRNVYKCPVSGWYTLTINALFAANATGPRYIIPLLNGTTTTGAATRVQAASTGTTTVSTVLTGYYNRNDQIGVRIAQNSGGNLTMNTNDYRGFYISNE